MQIAILSDTHGLLRPEVLPHLAQVALILHAGDVGDPAILDTLAKYAPVTAIRGNIDTHGPCALLPATEAVELEGRLFYLVHSLQDLDLNPVTAHLAAVITGHSHKAATHTAGGVLYLNPGSCGPRRFSLPVTMALLNTATMTPQIIHLL